MTRMLPLALVLFVLSACALAPGARVNNEKIAETSANIGIDYMRKEQYDLALTNLHKALRYNENHVNANWALGITYSKLKEPLEAERFYSHAAKLQPRPDILNSYAVFLCQQGKINEAVGYFERVASNPRYTASADALANAGFCLVQGRRLVEADPYFRQALERDPEQNTALQQLAEINYKLLRYLAARAFLQRLDAVSRLSDESLLLGARIELALKERDSALAFLRRYNSNNLGAALTLRQLQDQKK